jgi:pycsar effector protein
MTTSPDAGYPAALTAADGNARTELQRADAKATTLLSLTTAVLAGVITLAAHQLPGLAAIALWASTLPIGVAALLLMSAIRPRMGKGPAPVGSWLDAARSGPRQMLAIWQRDADESVTDAAHDVCVIFRIALGKYRLVRWATSFLLVALLDLGLAGLWAALAA